MERLVFMPHQIDVLNRTGMHHRCAYYLDMGLGKTFIGAEKLWSLKHSVNLVVCQKSKVEDWVQHFRKYYPEFRIYDLTKKAQSEVYQRMITACKNYKGTRIVGIVNYDVVFRRDWLIRMEDFTLMLDESSLITNENAKRSRAILKMQPVNVILLSGTPTAGKYEKLWSQLKLLGWNISKDTFWKSYVETEWVGDDFFKHEIVTGYKNVEHLKKRLIQFGAVFMKTEEVLSLPDQIEQRILLKQTKEYQTFMKNSYVLLKDGTELAGENSLTKMLYARQLCGHYHKAKLDALKDLVESTEDRIIIFYNFHAELKAMTTVLGHDRPVSIVNGKEKWLTAYEQKSNSITFVQYQAGAMGLNLQKAHRVIYFTLPLGKGSCNLWEQSKKRIHRIGQQDTCFYYYLLVKGSIEEKNLEALQEGKELTDALFKEPEKK